MQIQPTLFKDGYKAGHIYQYPADTEYVYSNLTPRASRVEGFDAAMFFGLQYFVKEFLQRRFDRDFFKQPKDKAVQAYQRRMDNYLGPGAVTPGHIAALHDLGHLPLRIKAVPEGTIVPSNVPVLTIINTKPEFFWLTNMLETLMSSVLWAMSTSATTAFLFRKEFQDMAVNTGGSLDFVPWQGHDFSFRGMCGPEAAMMSGAAHLLSFTGTDTIPAIDFLEEYYGANSDTELVGGSVPATEHSVMCMGLPEGEIDTFRRLLTEVYPTGILSVVSDTWDFWNVIDNILPALKDVILARNGKLVIRPDSGNPVHIICGSGSEDDYYQNPSAYHGAIQRLWDTFGGTVNARGYRELDPHIGLIYGDSINRQRQHDILNGLANNGFASTNIVLGIGSYTYQHVTRDTLGWAMKATWGYTRSRGGIDIFKDPLTDRAVGGSKKSHRGLLSVRKNDTGIFVMQQCTEAEEGEGLLETVFEDGRLIREQTLSDIRAVIAERL